MNDDECGRYFCLLTLIRNFQKENVTRYLMKIESDFLTTNCGCHIFAITCQIIMLNCQIFMSSCQIFILNCPIFMLTCHLFICSKLNLKNVFLRKRITASCCVIPQNGKIKVVSSSNEMLITSKLC